MSDFTRRTLLASCTAPLIAASQTGKGRPKNVLFIASDDLNTSLSCYGHPVVRTPNIDRIARSGVRFERAYCQFSFCSPSRSSLMTGMGPDTTGVYDLQTHFRRNLPDVVTLPQLFQKNGYFAGRVGKIYHYGVPGDIGTSGLDDPPSWNRFVNPKGVDKTHEEALMTNYTPKRGIGSAMAYHASSAPDEQHTDGIGAAAVIEMIEQHRRDPFFIGAGFYRPHVPWIVPSKYFDRIPLDRVQLPPFDESELRQAPEWAYWTKPANFGLNSTQLRECLRAYYASVEFLDAQVGKLMAALEERKLLQDTVIVFWGDNGYQFGEHGQWMKNTNFERGARIPLLIGGAGVKARGRVCGRTVELLDLYPTLAEVCGLQGTPANLQGRSLRPLLDNPGATWTKPGISQMQRPRGAAQPAIMGYSIRTERYRYTEWEFGAQGSELYDYETDPREVRNRTADPALSTVQKGLRRQLHEIVRARGGKPPAGA
jgi:uncharacterized sulfatase